jgi:two-component system, OmpR family, response regulator
MRILIVEDEIKMAGLLRCGLFEEGHDVDVAATGREAVIRSGATEYDAIILDLMLPDGNGFQVCRQLRRRGVDSPVLILTARDAAEDLMGCDDAGADDLLMKPFSFAELLARLGALAPRGQSKERASSS